MVSSLTVGGRSSLILDGVFGVLMRLLEESVSESNCSEVFRRCLLFRRRMFPFDFTRYDLGWSTFLTTRPFLDHVFPSHSWTLSPGQSSGSSFPEDGEFSEAAVWGLLRLDGLDGDGHLSVMEGNSVCGDRLKNIDDGDLSPTNGVVLRANEANWASLLDFTVFLIFIKLDCLNCPLYKSIALWIFRTARIMKNVPRFTKLLVRRTLKLWTVIRNDFFKNTVPWKNSFCMLCDSMLVS